MKSEMPYHGVPAPIFKQVMRAVFADYAATDAKTWQKDVLDLWRHAKYREERYAAIALTGLRAAKKFQTLDALPMYEEMIVTGAWWDHVDTLAESRVGALLLAYPGPMRKTMLAWSQCDDMWKRRTSILCQLKRKDETDLDLLYSCIAPSLDSKEFFLRKAIGWALRQLAWTNPDEVIRYVEANADRLSGLSRREALKNVGPSTAGPKRPRRPERARGTSSRRPSRR